jgi:hypothetical protein
MAFHVYRADGPWQVALEVVVVVTFVGVVAWGLARWWRDNTGP